MSTEQTLPAWDSRAPRSPESLYSRVMGRIINGAFAFLERATCA